MPSVSEPASVEEAARVVRHAAAEGLSVSIDRDGGDVVLRTDRLDRVLEHEAGDLTCVVESGVRLSALDERLARHGQMLALDPPGDPTVGACLAANLSGPRRHRYGTMRDLVLGVTVVLGDGLVASSGGKVVKNVAGYDLGKLYCGSRGRLGLIARVALRLHPRPAAARTLVASAATPEEAQAKAQALSSSRLAPSALDVVWPGDVALRFEGGARAVDAQLEAARALVAGEEADDALWLVVRERQGRALGRRSFPPGRLAETLATLDEAVVRVAAGVAYVPERVPDERDPAARALAERIRAQLDPAGVFV